MDPRFSEDEQTAKLKAWWQENRWSIIGGVGLGLAVVVGWNGWQSHTQKRADAASDIYERMIAEVEGNDLEAAQSAAEALKEDYASSVYAARAALYLARESVENADPARAKGELRWAMEHASEPASEHSARLRLAYLLAGEGEHAEAEALLNVADRGGFESHYEELLGDVYAATGRHEQARSAYRRSLESIPIGSVYRELLTMKLDNVAAGK